MLITIGTYVDIYTGGILALGGITRPVLVYRFIIYIYIYIYIWNLHFMNKVMY